MNEQEKKISNPYVHPIQENTFSEYGGMTLRDYFAAKAMQGLMSMDNKGNHNSIKDAWDKISEFSYGVADSMLKQREL